MKKGKLWALAAVCASVVLSAGTAAACNKHTHDYGDWSFLTAPTEDANGVASRECKDGDHVEEVSVAKLTDETVWTLSTDPATHDKDGKKTYVSEYGTVEVAIPKAGHTFEGADWKITAEPTLENGGKAERKCTANDSGVEVKDIPALSDDTVWTAEVKNSATHTTDGLTVYTSVYGSVNFTTPKLTAHEYGAWVITEKPALENGGKAVRECVAKDHTDEKELPALSDTDFWTYEELTPASHVSKGKGEYTSAYGKVEVEIPMQEHTYDGAVWTITEKPSLTAGGTAERNCTANDGGVDRKELPALTDSTVWTRDEASYVAPTDDKPGKATYNSVYGSVTVVLARLKEPYYNKTYYNFTFNNGADYKDRELNVSVAWDTAKLPVDGEGKGVGTGYPYNGAVSIVTKDFDTNELEITIDDKKYTAYADLETGVIVMLDSSYVYILTPYTREVLTDKYDEETETSTKVNVTHSVSDAKASAWTYTNAGGIASSATAISYNYADGKTINIFIDETGAVHFGVTFTDMEGDTVPAEKCYNNFFVYVKAEDEVIASFGYDGNKMNALDGLEGMYTDKDGNILYVTGYGTVALGPSDDEPDKVGTYKIVDGKLNATLHDNKYNTDIFYVITLDAEDMGFTAVKPEVVLRLNYGEYSTEGTLDWNININVPWTLPVPTSNDPTKIFVGWYTDADCEHAVELINGKYIPVEAVTLYAKWGTKVVIRYVLEENGAEVTIDCAEGDVIIDKLDTIGFDRLDIAKNRYFTGWYYNDGSGLVALPTNAVLDEENNGLVVYAKWEAIPAYYGSYEGKQMLSGGTLYEAYLDIDEKGNISGAINPSGNEVIIEGTVIAYNKETQVLSWKPASDESKTYLMWLNAEEGLLVIPADLSDNEMDTYPFVVSKHGAIGTNQAFSFYNGGSTGQGKTKLIAYVYDNDKLALMYTEKIYGNVSISDAFGAELTLDNVMASKTLVVKNSAGEIIVAFGTTAEAFNKVGELNALDAYFGIYEADGETFRLDGLGNIAWADKSGRYTLTSAEGDFYTFDVYEVKEIITETTERVEDEDGYYEDVIVTTVTYKNVAYHVLKLAKSAGVNSSFVTPNVTIAFDKTNDSNEDNTIPSVDSVETNKNIAITLPAPANTETSIFWGWYTDANHEHAVKLEDYIPSDSVTLYAWWRGKVTVTVNYNDGETENGKVEILPGSTADVAKPKRAGYRFVGWYKDASCTDGNEWIPGETEVSDNITIYAKWAEPYIYSQQYNILYIKGTNADGSTEFDQRGMITFDEDGFAPKGEYPFSRTDSQISDYDESAGTLIITSELSYGEAEKRHKTYIDNNTGLMAVNYDGGDGDFVRLFLLVPVSAKSDVMRANFKDSYWNNGASRTINLIVGDTVHSVFMHNNRVYFNVSFENSAGDAVSADTAYRSATLYIKASDGNLIAKFGYDGTKMNELDGYEDITYSGANGNLTVNGVDAIVLDGAEGTYALTDGEEYTADAYIGGSYYEVTLNKDNSTYSIVKPMVEVTYVTDYDSANAVSGEVNKNIAITLPVLTSETHIFRGWYIDDEAQLLSGEYIPAANVTFSAKWDIKVTLTVVYGNGLENATIEYGAGDTTAPVEPAYNNGQVFEGWYTDAEFATPYNPGAITEDTTIYCKWQNAVAMFGEYSGFETWGSTASGGTSYGGTSGKKLSVSANGVITGEKSGTVTTAYNEETGLFTATVGTKEYLVYFDSENGIIAGLYGGSATSIGNNDIYVFFKNASSAAASGASSYWLSGYARLMEVTLSGYKQDKMTLFIYNNALYANVTWTSTTANVTPANAYSADDLVVYDSFGKVIAMFAKDGSKGLQLADEYAGNYNGGLGVMFFNGISKVTLENVDEAGSYTLTADGEDYTADVYVGGSYYNVTLDKENGTYTFVKPMVTVTFSSDYDASSASAASGDVNKNIAIALPELTDGNNIFRGWYTDEACTLAVTLADGKYTPVENVTLYAKWDVIVTLTVVYGNGLDNAAIKYGAGDTVNPVQPELTAGKVFDGWYADEALETPYTLGAITEDTTIYCKWKEPIAMYGSYKGFNYWSSTSDKTNSSLTATFTVSADGYVIGRGSGDATNIGSDSFIYNNRYVAYDAQYGIVAEKFSASNETLGTDFNIYFKGDVTSVDASANLTSAGWTSVLTVHYKDGSSMNVLVYNDKVYGGVTWNDGVDALGTKNEATLTVKDASGNTIVTITGKVAS